MRWKPQHGGTRHTRSDDLTRTPPCPLPSRLVSYGGGYVLDNRVLPGTILSFPARSPRRQDRKHDSAFVNCEYNVAPFSGSERKKRRPVSKHASKKGGRQAGHHRNQLAATNLPCFDVLFICSYSPLNFSGWSCCSTYMYFKRMLVAVVAGALVPPGCIPGVC